jgi:hypothetical protein
MWCLIYFGSWRASWSIDPGDVGGKGVFSDGFVVGYDVFYRVSGGRGRHLSFTASTATHTGFHAKMCFRSVMVTPYLPGDHNFYRHLYRQPFTLTRATERTVADLFLRGPLSLHPK